MKIICSIFVLITFFSVSATLECRSNLLTTSKTDKKRLIELLKEIPNDSKLHNYRSGNLVLIIAPSSSGKSTLIEHISNKFLDYPYKNKIAFSGVDSMMHSMLSNYVRTRASFGLRKVLNQINANSDVVKLLYFPELIRYMNVCAPNDEKDSLDDITSLEVELTRLNAICPLHKDQGFLENALLTDIDNSLKQGRTVIFDVMSLSLVYRMLASNLVHCDIRSIVLFVQPFTLLERIRLRNKKAVESGNLMNIRLFFPFFQYQDIYQIAKESTEFSIHKSDIESLKEDFGFNDKSFSELLPETLRKLKYDYPNKDFYDQKKKLCDEWFPVNIDSVFLTFDSSSCLMIDANKRSTKDIMRIIDNKISNLIK